jgi:hypothetical protein
MKKPLKSLIVGAIVAVFISQIIMHYDELLPYNWQAFHSADGTFSVRLPGKAGADENQKVFVAHSRGAQVSPPGRDNHPVAPFRHKFVSA